MGFALNITYSKMRRQALLSIPSKRSRVHLYKTALILGTLASNCPLCAENNGAYGAVGFQYSNITQSTQNKAPSLANQTPLFNVQNAKPTTLPSPQVPQNKVGG